MSARMVMCAFALCVGAPLGAQSADCATLATATSRIYDKPVHIYTIDSAQTDAQLNGGRPSVSEIIWTGSAEYLQYRGKWMKSPIAPGAMRKNSKAASTKVKATCSHLRDESVNGVPAAVWRTHSVSEAGTTDTDIWVSRSNGMALKSDTHMGVGGSLGKSHIVSPYEYTNVRLPAGVQ
jgi:hypothetical protein